MGRLQYTIACIANEFNIFFAFSWRDWSTSLIPGSIWGMGAALQPGAPSLISLTYRFPRLILWVTFFVYFFTLANQIVGVDEDRINKPDRTIPSGKVTVASAKGRAIVVLAAFLGTAMISPRVLPETVCWVLTTAFHCLTPAGNHWLGKNNVGMSLGTPTTGTALWLGQSIHIQDLRDIDGDRATGRKTMAVTYGDIITRRIIAFFLLPSALTILWFWDIFAVAPISLIVVHIALGFRVMHGDSPRFDHKTYMVAILFAL
ncbi:hypothetical protein C8R43DRAFT_957000 [Mycena crocata]|nr:hypothetical protein C8R43DRAFT_957000 [Mycena crocata]